MDLLNPACDAPQYKIKANQKLGTQWHIDLAYGTYVLHRSAFGDHVAPNYALIHGNLNQRIIKDDVNGGTWLHAEFLGSWGLEKDAVRVAKGNPLGPLGSVTRSHAELVGPSDFYFPEISVKHFFNGKKAAIIAGTLRLSDYFDVVGIASDTYTSFMNSGFWHSTVLPLVDSNVGAIVQVQLGKKDYVMAGVSRTGTEPGYDPINSDGDGYVVMGEWGHYFNEGKGVVKVTPFFQMLDVDYADDSSEHHRTGGVVGSVQYTINDTLTVFVRGGVAAKQEYGNTAELTGGLRAKLIPSRKDDYLGIAYGVFKGRNYAGFVDEDGDPVTENYNCRETVLEAYYNLQLCRYFRVMPHIQYIHDPAYADNNDSVVFGVQGVFSF